MVVMADRRSRALQKRSPARLRMLEHLASQDLRAWLRVGHQPRLRCVALDGLRDLGEFAKAGLVTVCSES